jgi:uncharacterized protein YeaO (DUF488 family)
MIKVKSIYAKAVAEDGQRYLVDLFWPEGMKTRDAKLTEWISQLGPSYDLQRFNFNTANWDAYKNMYVKELMSDSAKKQKLRELADQSKRETITLLYGNKDAQHNHAVITKDLLESNFLNSKQS